MHDTHLRRTAAILPLKGSRCPIRTARVLLVVVVLLICGAGLNPAAQAAPTLSAPTLTIASDNCVPSSLAGPNYPEPGDTLTIASKFTNDTGSSAAFRAVVRVMSAKGGIAANKPVDLLYGGPTYIKTSGSGGTGWDDSYGYVVSTPLIATGKSYTIQANYSLLRQQLSNALNLANNATGSIDIKVALFSSDFSVFYGAASTTQIIKNTAKSGCPRDAIADSSPVLLTTNKATYTTLEQIVIEYSTIGADDVNKLPGWGDTSTGTVDIVRMDTLPTGNPELDYANNSTNIVRTISTWTPFNTPTCTIPCVVTDERLSTPLNYSYQVGTGVQAFTNRATVPALLLTNNKTYLVRARFGSGNGSSSHPIQQPQWTYFNIGDPTPTAVTLVSFTAAAQADNTIGVAWETATELNTAGFYLYRSTDGQRASAVQVTPEMIFAEGSGLTGARYTWTDRDVQPGTTYTYWLQEVETGGATNEYGPTTVFFPSVEAHTIFIPLIGR